MKKCVNFVNEKQKTEMKIVLNSDGDDWTDDLEDDNCSESDNDHANRLKSKLTRILIIQKTSTCQQRSSSKVLQSFR